MVIMAVTRVTVVNIMVQAQVMARVKVMVQALTVSHHRLLQHSKQLMRGGAALAPPFLFKLL